MFSDFQCGFRSSRSDADLLTVVFNRICETFNRSRATRAVALNIPKALKGFGMLVFFTNLSLMDFQVRYLALGPTLFLLYINDHDDVILLSMLMILLTTLSVIRYI